MRTHTSRLTAVLALAAAAAVPLPAAAASAESSTAGDYPVNWDTVSAITTGTPLDLAPPGANRQDCRPSAEHPHPVVLVHGLLSNQRSTWQALAPTLANEGYCVYTFTYGKTWYSGTIGGVGDLNESAKQMKAFVDKVQQWSGADKVDVVGHSEGGNLPRLYIKQEGGASEVNSYVSLAGVNMGPPSLSGIITVAKQIPGAMEVIGHASPAIGQLTDPAYFESLNKPTATYPGIDYTAIATTHDEAVTPYELALLPQAPNVRNITIQTQCPNDPVGHIGLTYDKTAVTDVLNALDPAHPRPVPCDSGFPL
ncbi:lipase class 2 [Streptomyces albus]|uniref:Lipase class 2 n=1 Tax=Streptomyces albus (strain ATCC 21838 / DSM 41398 / FERM P-419 / JCM 4703 / NBRC 107858) TaxID=1081613 RepID=A0A0B5F6Q5_STRA4|nr:lipase class 2 [Streptomyces albus]AOU81568.1 lipase class 2 [Streptomyces albus]AYN37261.1 triacylglycerol lipase [Streptomyces albus]